MLPPHSKTVAPLWSRPSGCMKQLSAPPHSSYLILARRRALQTVRRMFLKNKTQPPRWTRLLLLLFGKDPAILYTDPMNLKALIIAWADPLTKDSPRRHFTAKKDVNNLCSLMIKIQKPAPLRRVASCHSSTTLPCVWAESHLSAPMKLFICIVSASLIYQVSQFLNAYFYTKFL